MTTPSVGNVNISILKSIRTLSIESPFQRRTKISSERTEKENCTWSIFQKSRRARNRPRRVIWVVNGKGLTALRESKVMALQEQEIGIKVTRNEIWKEQLENIACRVCKEDRESVAHIMCGCCVLLETEYFKRHDGMMRVICYLLKKLHVI